ncbi:MAG: GNAT family N-acetyltransferase [Dehalococcoidia bacterium]|nr:GNAT family N-acetyltransferase [Dehalococcoidia bacterium]
MIEIKEEAATMETLIEYGVVSIAFLVESRYKIELINSGLGGWTLTEEPVENPYIKDYDEEHWERPGDWARRFNVSSWGILSAFEGRTRVGGAVIAFDTPEVNMLEGRADLALLWDLRIHPDHRRKGIGSLLFPRIVSWAASRQCTTLKIETQNINVPACKYYARMGCELRAIHPEAYPSLPEEVQLLWYKRI